MYFASSLCFFHPLTSLSACSIDIGGKVLTNHLKTLISFRHWNMMDQTHVVNRIKEQSCYVSADFLVDLDACK